jgi:hypothetical protein
VARKTWHDPDPKWAKRYDRAFALTRQKLGSYDKIAAFLFRDTGHSVSGQSLRRWQIERTLPLRWALSIIDLMREQDIEISVFDFYPYLEEYTTEW